MRLWLLRACVGVFLPSFVALCATNLVVWKRVAGRRSGRSPPAGHPPIASALARTSRATWLPGVAGLGAMGAGLVIFGWSRVIGAGTAAWGAFIAVAGFGWRVAGMEIVDSGLIVRYRHRPSLALAWSDCVELHPPRTPFGGWRLGGAGSSATLMPSDLLGLEWVLDTVIGRAGLKFGEGSWRSPAPGRRESLSASRRG